MPWPYFYSSWLKSIVHYVSRWIILGSGFITRDFLLNFNTLFGAFFDAFGDDPIHKLDLRKTAAVARTVSGLRPIHYVHTICQAYRVYFSVVVPVKLPSTFTVIGVRIKGAGRGTATPETAGQSNFERNSIIYRPRGSIQQLVATAQAVMYTV